MKKKDSPRTLIGGLHVQEKQGKMLLSSVDWLSFTMQDRNLEAVLTFLWDTEEYYKDSGGGYGYRFKLERLGGGGIKVYYNCRDNSDDQGIHVEISGKGFSTLRRPIRSLLSGLVSTGANITRLDIATDDFHKFTNLNTIEKHVRKKYLTSRFKQSEINVVVPFEEEARELGKTIYFGNRRQSDLFFRFYDKKAEQIAKLGYCDRSHWNRLEIVFKRDRALTIAILLAGSNYSNISEIVFSIFNKYLTFRQYNPTDSNKRRWKVCPWWERFINSPLEFNFTNRDGLVELDKTYGWISKQVSKSLYLLFKALDEDYNLLSRFLIDGERKRKQIGKKYK